MNARLYNLAQLRVSILDALDLAEHTQLTDVQEALEKCAERVAEEQHREFDEHTN